jgi:hypothetical protein
MVAAAAAACALDAGRSLRALQQPSIASRQAHPASIGRGLHCPSHARPAAGPGSGVAAVPRLREDRPGGGRANFLSPVPHTHLQLQRPPAHTANMHAGLAIPTSTFPGAGARRRLKSNKSLQIPSCHPPQLKPQCAHSLHHPPPSLHNSLKQLPRLHRTRCSEHSIHALPSCTPRTPLQHLPRMLC